MAARSSPRTATGIYQLVATATDLDGFTTTITGVLRVRDPLDIAAPVVSLDPVLGGRRVTEPIAVTAVVADTNLERWTLEIAPRGLDRLRDAGGRAPARSPARSVTLDPARFEAELLPAAADRHRHRRAQRRGNHRCSSSPVRSSARATCAPSPTSPSASAARRSRSRAATTPSRRPRIGSFGRGWTAALA